MNNSPGALSRAPLPQGERVQTSICPAPHPVRHLRPCPRPSPRHAPLIPSFFGFFLDESATCMYTNFMTMSGQPLARPRAPARRHHPSGSPFRDCRPTSDRLAHPAPRTTRSAVHVSPLFSRAIRLRQSESPYATRAFRRFLNSACVRSCKSLFDKGNLTAASDGASDGPCGIRTYMNEAWGVRRVAAHPPHGMGTRADGPAHRVWVKLGCPH